MFSKNLVVTFIMNVIFVLFVPMLISKIGPSILFIYLIVYSGIETIIDAKLQNRNTHLYIKEIISYIINIVWNFALIVAVANIIAIPAFTLVETIIAILIFLLAVSQLEVLIDKKLERF